MTSALPPATALQITPSAPISRELHGWRAKCLQRLVRMQLPVPRSFAIPADTVRMIAQGRRIQPDALSDIFAGSGLVSVRPSAAMPEWGGPGTVLNVGINDALHARLDAAGIPYAVGSNGTAAKMRITLGQHHATAARRLHPPDHRGYEQAGGQPRGHCWGISGRT